MEFSQPKGIYQQIADQMRDRILAGEWHEGERIPSVRELAVGVGVNPNTVTKSYQALLDREIIENQRGLGYFVATDAKKRIVDADARGVRARRAAEDLPHDARARHAARRISSRTSRSRTESKRHEEQSARRRGGRRGLVVSDGRGVAIWIRVAVPQLPELSGERASRT